MNPFGFPRQNEEGDFDRPSWSLPSTTPSIPLGVPLSPPRSPRDFRVFRVPPVATLNPVNPVNPVKNQPVPPTTPCMRVSDTMAVRQNTVRKSAFLPGGAASCRAAFGAAGLLPLLGGRSCGGWENLAAKDAKKVRIMRRMVYNGSMLATAD